MHLLTLLWFFWGGNKLVIGLNTHKVNTSRNWQCCLKMQVCLHQMHYMNSIQLKTKSQIWLYNKMIKRYSPLTCRLYYITFKETPVLSAKKCLCVNSLPEVLLNPTMQCMARHWRTTMMAAVGAPEVISQLESAAKVLMVSISPPFSHLCQCAISSVWGVHSEGVSRLVF